MPERLKVRMLCLNLKWFTTAADSEGVGLKAEQLTMRPSICRAHIQLRHSAVHLLHSLWQNKAACCPSRHAALKLTL